MRLYLGLQGFLAHAKNDHCITFPDGRCIEMSKYRRLMPLYRDVEEFSLDVVEEVFPRSDLREVHVIDWLSSEMPNMKMMKNAHNRAHKG
jgi:hypothetical protein